MQGLFVGLTTLDLIYRAIAPPTANQKLVASDYTVAAGGPATNAAVTFAHLGNRATIVSAIGSHPMTQLIRADLQTWGVDSVDLAPDRTAPPPVSSIIVTEATGDRAVISLNAVKAQVDPACLPPTWVEELLQDIDIVLIDGHQMALSAAIAPVAQRRQIPVVMDGGSWKPGFETVLPAVDYALCSANFQPPACPTEAATLAFLRQFAIPHLAITHGPAPITYIQAEHQGELPVPPIQAIDTLGAGDVFHGAFCHFVGHTDFVAALEQAATVAARSCQQFGTRRWMEAG